MTSIAASHFDAIAGTFAVAAALIAIELLLLVRRYRAACAANRPAGGDQ